MTYGSRHGTYTDVADEYYDAARHPTSANFRLASGAILRAWLRAPEPQTFCDVGAGDSLVAEIVVEQGGQPSSLTLLDSAPEMLAYSERWISGGAQAVIGRAEDMPFEDCRFEVIVASLGDPYNTRAFWRQAHRVLRPGGVVMFTTPSFEWAEGFRSRHQEPADCAEFLLRDGSRVLVPSVVLPERKHIDLMTQCGLSVRGVYHVLLAALQGERISTKLEIPAEAPFVTGYLATRVAR